MDQVFLSEKEDLWYQTALCEKDRPGRDGCWRGESEEDPYIPQNQRLQNPTQNLVVQNLCEKRNDGDWKKIKNTEAASESPSKKGNPDVKTKSKETPFAPQKKIKKNPPKQSSGGLKINFTRVKILKSANENKINDGFLS